MSRLAKICDALTLTGVGLLMWFGQGLPSVAGSAVNTVIAMLAALIFAKPFYEVVTGPSGIRSRLEQRFGIVSVYLIAMTGLMMIPYVYFLERLNRIEALGAVMTATCFASLVLYGFYRARRIGRKGVARLLSTLLLVGYAGTGGALLAGQVQFSIVAICGLGLAQVFDWFVFNRMNNTFWGGVFAFLIPLFMLLNFQIGHILAVPLIASFIWGTSLIFQSGEAKSPRQLI